VGDYEEHREAQYLELKTKSCAGISLGLALLIVTTFALVAVLTYYGACGGSL